MEGIVTAVTPVLALCATVISVVVGYGTIKQRKDAPNEKRWAGYEEWKAHVDECLNHDNRKIGHFEREFDKSDDFQRIMLRSIKGVLDHLASGNHGEDMKEIIKQIDTFLIDK
jgi:hypothetical protein